ncbi:hypothetical protein JXA40_03440 [bacterium]|nr:hypothetical protein [candidate division CSSED10-310 bacterium]
MKKFPAAIILLSLLMVLILAGDQLNLPLWPVDVLNPRVPVEFRFHLDGCEPELAGQILRHSHGVEMILQTASGRTLQSLLSDREGIIRTVLETGNYRVSAALAAVCNGEFQAFSSNLSPRGRIGSFPENSVSVNRQNHARVITLYPVRENSPEFIHRVLVAYLEDGDLNSAQVVARDLDTETAADVERLVELRNRFDIVPLHSYNAVIAMLEEMSRILEDYCPASEMKFRMPDETVHLQSRIAAVRHSRNEVIREHLHLMDESAAAGKSEAVLQEWLRMSHSEILPADPLEHHLISPGIEYYRKIIPELQIQLMFDIRFRFREASEEYRRGDLETARTRFTALLTLLRNMNISADYSDMETDIRAYLDDISLIFESGQAIKENKLEEALIMLDTIVHSNDLVHRRIEEIRRFLTMGKQHLFLRPGKEHPID